jgi:heme-degrading monooxygenase HmoA
MYFAMNRFRVAAGHEADFEGVWRARESHLHEVPGFVRFHLLRGETSAGETTFVSLSEWLSRDAFVAWTESEAFRSAHASGRTPEGTVLGPPRFEGYEIVDL